MPCPCCSAPLVEISISTGLTLRSCSRCDSRWWHRDGGAVGIDDVLAVVGAPRTS